MAAIANLRQSISDWIFRASFPEAPPVTLVQRRIFILPSRQGYVFAFVLLLLLIGSINYNLSLGYALTFLLMSMGGVAMLQAFHGPFPALKFCPTGGITAETAPNFLALPNVVCVGGSWLTPKAALAARNWDEVTRLARGASELAAHQH